MMLFLSLMLSIMIALILVVAVASVITFLDWIDDLQNQYRYRKQLKSMIKSYTSAAAMQPDPVKKAYFIAVALNCKYELINCTRKNNR